MSKTFVSDYIKHAARFYASTKGKNEPLRFKTEADKLNWEACKKTLADFTDNEVEAILAAYTYSNNPNCVGEYIKQSKEPPAVMWRCIKRFEQGFSKHRGL